MQIMLMKINEVDGKKKKKMNISSFQKEQNSQGKVN